MYCFKEIEGYSRIGKLVLETLMVPMIYTGFRPRMDFINRNYCGSDTNGTILDDTI